MCSLTKSIEVSHKTGNIHVTQMLELRFHFNIYKLRNLEIIHGLAISILLQSAFLHRQQFIDSRVIERYINYFVNYKWYPVQ